MQNSKALRYAKRLIRFESTSEQSNRYVAKYLEIKLKKHGFVVEKLMYRDARKVRKINLIAKKGMGTGGMAYFGHTDVVPAPTWFTRKATPFEPVVAGDGLYGRGACDMKGSLACMLEAAQSVNFETMNKPLYLVFTADEEVGFGGAKQVVEESKLYREIVQGGSVAVIGEPTMLDVVHAHKGSYLMRFRTTGKAAHSGTREGKNANWQMIPFLNDLWRIREETETIVDWFDENFSPPTVSMNLIMSDSNQAVNVTSARCTAQLYLRPMPQVDCVPLVQMILQAAKKHEVQVDFKRNCEPMWSDPDSDLVKQALTLMGASEVKTAGYATDAGVLSEIEQKIIFGPGSIAQAHTNQEFISFDQMQKAVQAYTQLILHYCGGEPIKPISV